MTNMVVHGNAFFKMHVIIIFNRHDYSTLSIKQGFWDASKNSLTNILVEMQLLNLLLKHHFHGNSVDTILYILYFVQCCTTLRSA